MPGVLAEIGWPVLDRIQLFGDLAISPHGIGIAIGFLFGTWILQHEGPKRGLTVEHINTMVFWALIGTIIGARLFYVIGHFSEFDGVGEMLALWNGGLTLLGGIAGAVLINVPLMRRYGYSFFQVMDGAVIGIAFGIAFGRIGDLIIGDHLGKPTSWALAFGYEGGQPAGFSCVAEVCRTHARGRPGPHDRARQRDAHLGDRRAPRERPRRPPDGAVRHVLRHVHLPRAVRALAVRPGAWGSSR